MLPLYPLAPRAGDDDYDDNNDNDDENDDDNDNDENDDDDGYGNCKILFPQEDAKGKQWEEEFTNVVKSVDGQYSFIKLFYYSQTS